MIKKSCVNCSFNYSGDYCTLLKEYLENIRSVDCSKIVSREFTINNEWESKGYLRINKIDKN